MKNYIIIFILLIYFLTSCSAPTKKELKLSTTTWIGYTPLFYAKSKGWLEEINIKLLHVVSLSENMYLYKAGNSDAYTGTQYEFNLLKGKDSNLFPIMLFDRSNGGDIVMSNMSIKKLQSTKQSIYAYLEIDSINSTILNDFLKKFNLRDKSINYINKDQAQISILKNDMPDKPTIIITYIPYNVTLEKNGFIEIASTKNNIDILVLDALFTKKSVFKAHKQQFIKLKEYLDKSIIALEKDPKEFYNAIKPYMEDFSYKDFIHSLEDIIWMNKGLPKNLKTRMDEMSFSTKELL